MTRDDRLNDSGLRKCVAIAQNLPGGLTIESFIDGTNGDCTVRAGEEASHTVRVRNRTLLRFDIAISAESESDRVRYKRDQPHWMTRVQAGDRRHTDDAWQVAEEQLFCDDTASGERVRVTIAYTAVGCGCAGSSTMQLHLDTGV